jgi:hypothetical protein
VDGLVWLCASVPKRLSTHTSYCYTCGHPPTFALPKHLYVSHPSHLSQALQILLFSAHLSLWMARCVTSRCSIEAGGGTGATCIHHRSIVCSQHKHVFLPLTFAVDCVSRSMKSGMSFSILLCCSGYAFQVS